MLQSIDFYNKYGHPSKLNNIAMWDVPASLEVGVIPKRIYCNKDIVEPLTKAFQNLISTGCVKELITWDGCYNFRPIRGYENKYNRLMKAGLIDEAMRYLSVHSWGGAVDMNAFKNPLGGKSTWSFDFVQCFIEVGMEWGGLWKRPDPMHFQLASFK